MLTKIKPASSAQGQSIETTAVREIGHLAVWSLSSAKPGFGVHQLRDGNTSTYWQSDGPQPHCVNVQWARNVSLERVELYTDVKVDESYTPSVVR